MTVIIAAVKPDSEMGTDQHFDLDIGHRMGRVGPEIDRSAVVASERIGGLRAGVMRQLCPEVGRTSSTPDREIDV